LDWIEHCFTSPPTQYRLYGRRFLQIKDPTNIFKVQKEMPHKRKKTTKTTKYTYTQTIMYTQNDIHKISTASPLIYNNIG